MTVTTTTAMSYPVKTLSGQILNLQTAAEQTLYVQAQRKYRSENEFTIASDLRALDRLIFYELQIFRCSSQLASGRNYDEDLLTPSEEDRLRKQLKEIQPLLSTIQIDLGLTKAARDRDSNDSVATYIQNLKVRAKEFGIHREKQLGKALELSNELFSLCGTFRRSDTKERRKIGIENAEQIVDWILDYMQPEFEAVDEAFRAKQQKYWIRSL